MALLIAVVLIPLWFKLRKDFIGGLCYAIGILLIFTTLVRIEMPGALPQLTIQRFVILLLFLAWLRHPERRSLREVPFSRLMAIWASLAFISLLGAVDPVAGVKRYLEFVLELFVFYFIVATTLSSREDALRLLRSTVIALSIVAVLAVIERNSGVNVVDRFVGSDPEALPTRDVRVTYRHRILFGAGMAMAVPLAAAMIGLATTKFRRVLAMATVLLTMVACYYSMSRGPWLGVVCAAMVMVIFGSFAVRKPILIVAMLSVLVLLANSGVRETLFRSASDTVDTDSFKGGTFQYRLELWRVAFNGIKGSPWRMLFGNGPAAGLNQTINWELSYRQKEYRIESWDNDLAYSLFQYGVPGVLATVLLYGGVVWYLLGLTRRSSGPQRDLFVCLCASTVVLFFMMSNVHIFARQLYYLFWTVAAVGFALSRFAPKEISKEQVTPAREFEFTTGPSV